MEKEILQTKLKERREGGVEKGHGPVYLYNMSIAEECTDGTEGWAYVDMV